MKYYYSTAYVNFHEGFLLYKESSFNSKFEMALFLSLKLNIQLSAWLFFYYTNFISNKILLINNPYVKYQIVVIYKYLLE